MNEKWLKCTVHEGMFSDEYSVTVAPKQRSGRDVTSVFVPRDLVRRKSEDSPEGLLQVRVYRQGSTWWAVLPSENQVAIPVGDADLMSV